MERWELVVTHPFALAALGLSLLFYFIAARRREWQESRLMNYVFGVLAAGVLVGGLALARREILKPRPNPTVEQPTGAVRSPAVAKPSVRPSAVHRRAKPGEHPAVAPADATAKAPDVPGAEEPKRPDVK